MTDNFLNETVIHLVHKKSKSNVSAITFKLVHKFPSNLAGSCRFGSAKTKPSVQDQDPDFAFQDQDLFVMYTRGRPKETFFHFRP